MRTTGMSLGRLAPAGAALTLALPLAGAGMALAAGGSPMPEAGGDGIPGLDTRRVVVPSGELAGRALQVSEVASRLEPAAALARVERHWREQAGASVLRAESGAWSVLSRQVADGFETLQLRASTRGGSEGLLARWGNDRAQSQPAATLGHLLPDDARVVRQLSSRDGGARDARMADTLLGRLPHWIDEAERRIDRHLRRAGFTEMRRPQASRGIAWRNDRARFYRNAGAELLVTLHAQPQGTAVVLYHVRVSP